ncbi:BRO-N domain-containing protein [Pseudomonas aeruginosa]|uniref:BRO-N domain-containing protein n=1 Tax=Pseudomonas aeruginosa TaxID=287 RepID=UPI0012987BA5|nr:Bro-N domain-containing protein [Pseudomonas aeruginosa]
MSKNSGHEKAPVLAGAEALDNVNRSRKNVMSDNSTNVIPFNFGKQQVRTLLIDGDPWFVAADIAAALQYRDSFNMCRNLDEDEKGTQIVSTLGGAQEMLAINESGLYAAILRSRKQEAKLFKKWVTGEVLPAIRKTGRYDDQQGRLVTLIGQTIGTDGFHCLAAVVDGKVRHLPSAIRRGAKNHIWSQVHKAFSVVTAEDIPADRLDSARNFIAAYAMEGEWLPKDRAASAVDTCSWSNIAFLVDCVEKCWKIVESRRLATHLSGLGCNAGVELAGFLWDGLGSAAHVRKHCAKQLNWSTRASA